MTRSFFRCLSCGHVTPYRAGPHGIVAHNDKVHERRGRIEHTQPAPGHAVLKRRYTDDWEIVDLTDAAINVEWVRISPDAGPWTLLIERPGGDFFVYGDWRSQRTAENKRHELRKIGRAGQ